MIEHRPAGVTTSAPVTAPDAARRRTMARALDAEAARNREQLARDRAQRARSNRPVTDREVRQVVAVLLNRKAVNARADIAREPRPTVADARRLVAKARAR